jgi:hypothetical protein
MHVQGRVTPGSLQVTAGIATFRGIAIKGLASIRR